MANPLLRRYSIAPVVANTWGTYGIAVPNNRALVVSKIVVANIDSAGAAATFNLAAGPQGTPTSADLIAFRVTLGPGEIYAETGVVLLAGSLVSMSISTASLIVANIFGEEVDNVASA